MHESYSTLGTCMSIKKEACWTTSSITAGNKDQIRSIIEADLFLPLVYLLQNAGFEIKKNDAWVISKAPLGGTHEQIKFLVNKGMVLSHHMIFLSIPTQELSPSTLARIETLLHARFDVKTTVGDSQGRNAGRFSYIGTLRIARRK